MTGQQKVNSKLTLAIYGIFIFLGANSAVSAQSVFGPDCTPAAARGLVKGGFSRDEILEACGGTAATAGIGSGNVTGTWTGTWKRNDTSTQGQFTLSLQGSGDTLTGFFSDRKADKTVRSGSKVTMIYYNLSGCKGAKLVFDFAGGIPQGGRYNFQGSGTSCNRGGTYTFP